MRKFLWMVAVGALVLAVAAPAMALDFKFGSEYRVRFYNAEGLGFGDRDGAQGSHPRGAQLRVRPRFDTSDDNGNITATLRLEIGDIEFGNGGGAHGVTNGPFITSTFVTPGSARVGNGSGGSLGNDGVNVETKWAYIDFAMPWGAPLRVRAGIQPWFTPKAILVDDDVIGVRAYGEVKPISYEVAWYRSSGGPITTAVPSGAAGQSATSNLFDNNYDFYQFRTDVAVAPWFNPGLYYIFGRNATNCTPTPCPPANRVRESHYVGLTTTGKLGTVSYDLDFVYGYADGGPAGTFGTSTGNLGPRTVAGFALDGGVHFPVGPVTVSLVAAYGSGDTQTNQTKSSAMPTISPSWNGAGGLYEMIGSGGPFDAVEYTQDWPVNIWMIGTVFEYRPVKPLYTKLAWGYAGFAKKAGNCADTRFGSAGFTGPNVVPTCFGPAYLGRPDKPLAGKSGLGNEFSLFAAYDLWTGFKVQGELGWLIPLRGDIAQEYVLQLYYNF